MHVQLHRSIVHHCHILLLSTITLTLVSPFLKKIHSLSVKLTSQSNFFSYTFTASSPTTTHVQQLIHMQVQHSVDTLAKNTENCHTVRCTGVIYKWLDNATLHALFFR